MVESFTRWWSRDSSSCSSSISPTISSTRSSSVTMPAVPPYSSTTTANCSGMSRSSRISGSRVIDSETTCTGTATADAGVVARSSKGTDSRRL